MASKTLPSMQAVKPEQKETQPLSPDEVLVAIQLRNLMRAGYSKQKIINILMRVRDDNL